MSLLEVPFDSLGFDSEKISIWSPLRPPMITGPICIEIRLAFIAILF